MFIQFIQLWDVYTVMYNVFGNSRSDFLSSKTFIVIFKPVNTSKMLAGVLNVNNFSFL